MTQLNNLHTLPQTDTFDPTHNIKQILKIMLTIAVVTIGLHLYLAMQTGDYRLFGAAGSVFGYFIVSLISLMLIRRHQPVRAALFLIFPLPLAFISYTWFIAGFGYILALSALLIAVLIAGLTLPQKWMGWVTTTIVILSVILVLEDTYLSHPRLTIPTLQVAVPGILGILILILAYFVVRQFPSYSLRTKLIIAFLVVSLLSVGLGAFFISRVIRNIVIENVGSTLQSVVETQALAVGDLLAQQVDRLQALSLNKTLQNRIERTNSAYPADSSLALSQLAHLDQQWQAANLEDTLVRSRMSNDGAVELRKFHDNFPEHAEVFITDKYGGLLATTNRTTDYFQADEEWWRATFDNGQGNVYIGYPEFDKSIGKFGLIIALPIRNPDTNEVIGVLRSTYRLSALRSLLDSSQQKQAGYADLYLPNNQLFSVSKVGPVPASPEDLTSLQLASLQASNGIDYILTSYRNEPSLVSQAPVRTIIDVPAVNNLGWKLLIHQQEELALIPVGEQLQNALLLALGIMSLAALAAVGVAQLLARPISRLTNTAAQVAAGNLQVQALVESSDEIGTLATIFNTMTRQLRELIDSLEARVSARTRQLETVVEISQRLTGILDLSDLLREVVNRTKETFNYYHAHIYLLDDKGEMLTLAQGYGEAGAEMKSRGHHIPLDAPRSLVARAAREGRVIIVENVREEPDWLPNPLLPETHSEMAVPIILGSQVVGVLDVQSEKVGGLTGEDETTLQALANQVAVAVRNARLFTETQEALYEAQRLQQMYTNQAWEKLTSTRSTNYEFRQTTLPPLQQVSTPEAMAALQQKQTVDLRWPARSQAANGHTDEPSPPVESQAPVALATPLKLRDQIIGVLGIHSDDPERRWTPDEIALIEAVSEQMSLAIENARLFEDSQRNAWRDQVISESTAKLWSSAEIEEVMQAAVAQLGEKLHASEVVIRLGTEDELVQR